MEKYNYIIVGAGLYSAVLHISLPGRGESVWFWKSGITSAETSIAKM